MNTWSIKNHRKNDKRGAFCRWKSPLVLFLGRRLLGVLFRYGKASFFDSPEEDCFLRAGHAIINTDRTIRTRIHNHLIPSERVFCRPAALKNLAIHKVLSAFFRLAGQQNPSPIRHPLIMNTGSKTVCSSALCSVKPVLPAFMLLRCLQ